MLSLISNPACLFACLASAAFFIKSLLTQEIFKIRQSRHPLHGRAHTAPGVRNLPLRTKIQPDAPFGRPACSASSNSPIRRIYLYTFWGGICFRRSTQLIRVFGLRGTKRGRKLAACYEVTHEFRTLHFVGEFPDVRGLRRRRRGKIELSHNGAA